MSPPAVGVLVLPPPPWWRIRGLALAATLAGHAALVHVAGSGVQPAEIPQPRVVQARLIPATVASAPQPVPPPSQQSPRAKPSPQVSPVTAPVAVPVSRPSAVAHLAVQPAAVPATLPAPPAGVAKVEAAIPAIPQAIVTPPRHDAAYLHNPQPEYPLLARRRREEGLVRLRVRVSAEGRAELVEVADSSGSPRLDQAAQQAVRLWRFEPARSGDNNIADWVEVPIGFKLEK